MININIKNIEELILKNSKTTPLFPELRHLFDKWLLSYRIPALSDMRKQTIIDLLNSLDGSHVEKLARLFGDVVFIEKLDHHIVRNLDFPTDSNIIERELTKYESYTNIALSRNADQVYITMWR
jgi:hypothetical protein